MDITPIIHIFAKMGRGLNLISTDTYNRKDMKFSKLQLAAILKLGMEVANLEDKEKTNEEFEVILQ